MIEMAKRRVQPGSGSALEFLRRRTAVEKWPDLRDILKDIPWVMVGGVATRAYMPERRTKDMDILVRSRDGKRVLERLENAGYKVVSRLAVPGYLLRGPANEDLDVIFGSYSWIDKALSNPTLDPALYPTIPLPYLVLMKLAAARGQDWVDVSRMVAQATEETYNEIRRVVAKYSREDLDDLESLVFLGKKELELPTDRKRTKSSRKRKSKK